MGLLIQLSEGVRTSSRLSEQTTRSDSHNQEFSGLKVKRGGPGDLESKAFWPSQLRSEASSLDI